MITTSDRQYRVKSALLKTLKNEKLRYFANAADLNSFLQDHPDTPYLLEATTIVPSSSEKDPIDPDAIACGQVVYNSTEQKVIST